MVIDGNLKCQICLKNMSEFVPHDCEKEGLFDRCLLLDQENAKLYSRLLILKEALTFYSKTAHWQDRHPETGLYYEKGQGLFYIDGDFIVCDGGDIARMALSTSDRL